MATPSYLQPAQAGSSNVNIGDLERTYCAFGWAALTLFGLRRGSIGGLALAAVGGALVYRGIKGHCPAYTALGVSSSKPAEPSSYEKRGINVQVAYTIDRPAAELYAYWRNFENLPSFMLHLQSVTNLSETKSKWVAKAPAGFSVEWEAEIINDEPGKLIAWRSLAGAQVDNAGSVRFVEGPEGRGTEVRVNLDYIPPGRTVGKWVAKLFGEDPQTQIESDLYRFKQLMETGVIPTIEGQSRGSK